MKSKPITILFSFIFLFISSTLIAQEDFEDDTDDSGAPAAPIDGFIIVSLVAGSAFGYQKLKSKK